MTAMESFFKSLKVECIYPVHFRTREEARQVIYEYIEVFYNHVRLHSTLGYKTPAEYEKALA
jgi:putative transposase